MTSPEGEARQAVAPCDLGYEEHDGTRYCFEHGGFALSFIRRMTCDRKPMPYARATPDEPAGHTG